MVDDVDLFVTRDVVCHRICLCSVANRGRMKLRSSILAIRRMLLPAAVDATAGLFMGTAPNRQIYYTHNKYKINQEKDVDGKVFMGIIYL